MRFHEWIATLNLVLILVGYPFAASLLTPLGYNAFQSQLITVPYRLFALFISLICVLVGMQKKAMPSPMPRMVYLFMGCFALCILRLFVDFSNDRTGFAAAEAFRTWGLVVSSFFAALSVLFSFKIIDFRKALFLILILSFWVMIVNKIFNSATTADLILDHSMERQVGSAALFSIAYSNVGVNAAIICFYVFLSKYYNILYKSLVVPLCCLSFVVMLSTGSRSPVLAFSMTLIFWIASGMRVKFIFYSIAALFAVIFYMLRFTLVDMLVEYVPLLGQRFHAMLYNDFYSGRDLLVADGLQQCISSPILGSSTINVKTGVTSLIGYHTYIVDALAYFGVIGGGLFLFLLGYMFFISISMFSARRIIPNFWINVMLLNVLFFKTIGSGLFHIDQMFSTLIILGICFYSEYYKRLYGRAIR